MLAVPSTAQSKKAVHFIDVGQGESILLEFDHAAVLIDAGGELTCNGTSKNPVRTYLNKFFERRIDLKRTIHTIIISHPHPHLDHTMWLVDTIRNFRVLNLIDGGNMEGSGIEQVFAARYLASQKGTGITYWPVTDKDVNGGKKNPALEAL